MMYLMGGTGVKVVILNACKTAKQDARAAIMGVAPALVAAEIPAVIAMQFNVPDKTALGFTRDLYRFLVSGYPLDTAVTEMRIGAYIGADDRYFWGIPVLFMIAPDGVIWQPDPELLEMFAQAQAEAADIGEPDLPALVETIVAKFAAIEGELDARDARYIRRDLEDLQEMVAEENPRLSYLKRAIEGIQDGLNASGHAVAADILPLLQQAQSLAEELYGQ